MQFENPINSYGRINNHHRHHHRHHHHYHSYHHEHGQLPCFALTRLKSGLCCSRTAITAATSRSDNSVLLYGILWLLHFHRTSIYVVVSQTAGYCGGRRGSPLHPQVGGPRVPTNPVSPGQSHQSPGCHT